MKKRLPKTVKEIQVQIALGSLDPIDIMSLLKSKKTSSEAIEIIYKSIKEDTIAWENLQQYKLIAKHLNTPATVLTSMFHRGKFIENIIEDPEALEGEYVDAISPILSHPSFPITRFEKFFYALMHYTHQQHLDYTCMVKIIENPNIPIKFLEEAAQNKNAAVRTLVAAHPKTPPEILEVLSTDKGHYRWTAPQMEVATNSHTPQHVLTIMSTSSRVVIRQKIAANLQTPINTLKTMITNDRSPNARRSALYNLFKRGKITFTEE